MPFGRSEVTIFGNLGASGDGLRQARLDVLEAMTSDGPRSVVPRAPIATVLALAERFALSPRVASRLRADADGVLEELNAATAARNALLLHAARAVSATLAAQDIGCIVLKGGAMLARGVAVDVGERHSDDIDILVPRGLRDRAFSVLLEAGYSVADSAARPAVDGRAVAEQEVRAGGHSAPTLWSPFGVPIDLHDVIPDALLSDFEALSSHCDTPAGTSLRVPRPPALLAQICDHVVVHHQARPSYVARHVADMAAFEARFGRAVWSEATPLCHPVSSRVSRLFLALARTQSPAAGVCLLPTERVRVAVEVAWESRDVVGRVRRDLARDPRRVLRKVWPDRSFVAASYGVDVDDPRLPLLYVHRLATLRWLLRPFYG